MADLPRSLYLRRQWASSLPVLGPRRYNKPVQTASFSSLVFSPRVLYTIGAETSIDPKSHLHSCGFHSHQWVSLPAMNEQRSNEGRENKL